MSTATASDFEIAPARPLLMPLASAAACVALADWLFYGWQVGISLALFFGVLGVVTANAATLALVLYGCCFINTPWLVASYNVEHCREVGGTGPNLDLQYLASLGPQALPPIEAHMTQFLGVFPYSLLYRMNQDLDYSHIREIGEPGVSGHGVCDDISLTNPG